jgi:hypothetical protein
VGLQPKLDIHCTDSFLRDHHGIEIELGELRNLLSETRDAKQEVLEGPDICGRCASIAEEQR